MAKEGLKLERLIGPKTEHKYHPESKAALATRLEALVATGRKVWPEEDHLTTYTLRYASSSRIKIMEQEAAVDLGGDYPVLVPPFMKEVVEQVTIQARKSKYVDHQSGVSARFSIANYKTMIASARHRGIRGAATQGA